MNTLTLNAEAQRALPHMLKQLESMDLHYVFYSLSDKSTIITVCLIHDVILANDKIYCGVTVKHDADSSNKVVARYMALRRALGAYMAGKSDMFTTMYDKLTKFTEVVTDRIPPKQGRLYFKNMTNYEQSLFKYKYGESHE